MALIRIVFIVFLCWLQLGRSAPFTPNSIITLNAPDSTNFVIQEYAINGTKLQTLDLPQGYFYKGFTLPHLDSTGTTLVFPFYKGVAPSTIFYAYRLNSEAQHVDTTTFDFGGLQVFDVQVDGTDIWWNWVNGIAYGALGGNLIEGNIVYGPNLQLGNTQLMGTKLFAIVNGDLKVMDPIGRSGLSPMTTVLGSLSAFHFYDNTTVYGIISDNIVKFNLDSQYKVVSTYPIVANDGGTPRNVFAMDVDGVRYVFWTACATGCKLHRATDTGSAFTDDTILDTSGGDIHAVVRTPIRTCSDGLKNQDETDVDCGGSICSACINTKMCIAPNDCESGYCNPDNICSTPSCGDGFINQDETDIDCGGSTCSACTSGKSCKINSDCENNMCVGNICESPPVAPPVSDQSPQSVDSPSSSTQPSTSSPVQGPSASTTPVKKGVSTGNAVECSVMALIGCIVLAWNYTTPFLS